MSTKHKQQALKLLALCIFGAAFGLIEAVVVYYLRIIMHFHGTYTAHYKVLLNFGFITFIAPVHSLLHNAKIDTVEMFREAATIIMLFSVSYIAGRNWRQRLGAFLVSFAVWDITYYIYLKLLDNWPASLLTKDIFFLIPVPWVGPVITPLLISTLLFIIGCRLYLHKSHEQ